MAENKRPQRPVYNYGNEASKTDKGRPQRVSYGATYDTKQDTRTQAARKARVQYNMPPQKSNVSVPPLPPSASPFYDVAADAPVSKGKKSAMAQEDSYTELVFPPRTVITATREIPQYDRTQTRSGFSQTAARSPVPLPQQSGAARRGNGGPAEQRGPGQDGKGRGATQRPQQAGKPRKRSLFGALFRAKQPKGQQQGKTGSKRHVVLSDARAQRRRRNVFAAIGIVAAVVTGVVLSLTVLFKIDSIVVEGDTPYTPAEIILAFGRKEGDNLFTFNTKAAVADMQKKLPYLENVKIQRILPSKVRIEATRAVEAYSVSSISGWVVLSDTLRVLRIDPQPPEGLPHIAGAEAIQPVLGETLVLEDPEKLTALQAVQAELNKQELLPVTEINLSDTLNLSFIYAGRIRIILGTHNDLANKIDWAKYLVTPSGKESLSETESGTLDVSNRNEEGRMETIWRAGAL